MLTRDEERAVEQILLEFVRKGQSRATDMASIMSRLPSNPEAISHLISLAHRRVLATLVSVLGQRGSAADGPLLEPLLAHEDERVVANSLEALGRLSVVVPFEKLAPLLALPDNRVLSTALGLVAARDPNQALELI